MHLRYQILEPLGEGGGGMVFRARDTRLNRDVAIKRLRIAGLDAKPLAESESRLHAEAKILSALQHPGIVCIYDFGTDEEGPYVVMELLEGETLDAAIAEAPFSAEDFSRFARQALDALRAAHARGILHRDLKPSNCMLVWTSSEQFQVKLLDFGLARLARRPTKQTVDQGAILGSLHFMAPEQLDGGLVDARSDLYSLGCTFYFVLSGIYPFDGDSASEIVQSRVANRFQKLADLRPDLPASLCSWVARFMHPDPRQRPASAKESLQLLQISGMEPLGEHPPASSHTAASETSRHRPAIRAAAVAGFLALLLGAFALGRWLPQPSDSPSSDGQATATALPRINSTDMAKFRELVGLRVVVEGVVTRAGESHSGKTRYLNFGRRPGEAIALAFRTQDTDTEFSMDYLSSLEGRLVRAEGVVENVHGALQIFISSRGQLEIR